MSSYTNYTVETTDQVAVVAINRPDKANALNQSAWEEMKAIFDTLSEDDAVRVIILKGNGNHFCAGIDLELLMSVQQLNAITCEARKREKIRGFIKMLQAPINAIEECRKPVIAAIHNGCIGGGLDISLACDMRFCTEDAYFTIKELDMGMVADLGTLQRLPKVVNYGFAAEMAYTGRKVYGSEAQRKGLVNEAYKSDEELYEKVLGLAQLIAQKSPVSVRGSKEIIRYSRDHTVAEGLEYMSVWNSAFLFSTDLMAAFQASMTKQTPVFED